MKSFAAWGFDGGGRGGAVEGGGVADAVGTRLVVGVKGDALGGDALWARSGCARSGGWSTRPSRRPRSRSAPAAAPDLRPPESRRPTTPPIAAAATCRPRACFWMISDRSSTMASPCLLTVRSFVALAFASIDPGGVLQRSAAIELDAIALRDRFTRLYLTS